MKNDDIAEIQRLTTSLVMATAQMFVAIRGLVVIAITQLADELTTKTSPSSSPPERDPTPSPAPPPTRVAPPLTRDQGPPKKRGRPRKQPEVEVDEGDQPADWILVHATFYRDGDNLVRVENREGVLKIASCPSSLATLVIRRLIEARGFDRNVNLSTVMPRSEVRRVTRTIATDWLRSLEMIRKMQGCFRLRVCDESNYVDVLRSEFSRLPDIKTLKEDVRGNKDSQKQGRPKGPGAEAGPVFPGGG
jgi:hypothetical protein